jgi:hypothetical protein
MRALELALVTFAVLSGAAGMVTGAEVADKCLENLPAGCFVTKSIAVPQDQRAMLGKKLGARLKKLSNNWLIVQGKAIRVNILDAETQEDASRAYKAILATKKYPALCLQIGARVVEYVGDDPNQATKTSWELGFLKKPAKVRYRIVAQVSTIDKADYMRLNELFNVFLSMEARNPDAEAVTRVKTLTEPIQFGASLTMRDPGLGAAKSSYVFSPEPIRQQENAHGEAVTYSFGKLPETMGVPYVTATMEIATSHTGLTPSTRRADRGLLSATPFWPVDDSEIVALAKRITGTKKTSQEKVEAILTWLAPGRNIEFGGEVTGSRWGAKKVLEQKKGHCWDFSDCFVTLGRASGVSCRQVGGWLYGTSGHIWAEYLVEGEGWKQVDPTGLRCGIYHIPYFVTEDGQMPILYTAMPKIEIVAGQ